MTTEYLQVFTTVSSREDAERIARTLVERRLAGCVQVVGPIISTYWWKGKIEKSEEWLCMAKSNVTFYRKLEQTIKAVHSYEVPEIVAFQISRGSPDYLRWLESTLTRSE